MSRILAVGFACALLGGAVAQAFEKPPRIFEPCSVILFQGDSITHGGRMSDMNHFLGHGYQAEIAMRYLAYRPEDNLQFGNRGESGHTSADLVKRWNRDAFPYTADEDGYRGEFGVEKTELTPDVLSILIGINDYLCEGGHHVEVADFERNLELMVTNSLAANPKLRIVLCEPFRLPVDESSEFVRRQKAVRDIAAKYNLAFVPFQTLFTSLTAIHPRTKYWFWDLFHPTYAAHMHMADFWIETVKKEFAAGRGRPRGKDR